MCKKSQMSSDDKQRLMFEMVEQWKASGETIKDFVAFHKISISKFQYWHKKYREQHATAEGGFIQLHASGVRELRLRYPNGVELLLPSGASAALIAELILLV